MLAFLVVRYQLNVLLIFKVRCGGGLIIAKITVDGILRKEMKLKLNASKVFASRINDFLQLSILYFCYRLSSKQSNG